MLLPLTSELLLPSANDRNAARVVGPHGPRAQGRVEPCDWFWPVRWEEE